MKATGIVRKMDPLGRIVFPKELRDKLGIKEGTPMEIFTEGDNIIIKEYKSFCIFCSGSEDNFDFEGKKICKKCIEKMNLRSGLYK